MGRFDQFNGSSDRVSALSGELEDDPLRDARRAIAAAAVVFGAAAIFCLWVEMLSLATFQLLPVATAVSALPHILQHLPSHFSNPRLAWPQALRGYAPNRFLLWPLSLIFFGVMIRLGLKAKERFWTHRRNDRGGTAWAGEKELDPIANVKKYKELAAGVVLGVSEDRKRLLRLEPENHALVVAGTRSGKTAGLCIPALLTFKGAVIATSVKGDLVTNTIKQRQKMGDVYIFDPVGTLGLPDDQVAGWTPLAASGDWRGAQRTAAALIEVTLGQSGGGGNMDFFMRQSQIVLPILLLAAAKMDEDMTRVLYWLHRINQKNTHSEVDSILRWQKDGEDAHSKALTAWVGFVGKDQKLRENIAATIQTALVSYEDEKVQENAKRCDITPEKFFNGGQNTLYVVAPIAEQARLEPVFVALMQSMLLWVSEQPDDLETPLLVVLDEAANIAAMPLLPNFLSTLGSKRVQMITAWQDFAQIKDRYGTKMNTIINNSRGKLILPGMSDPETLQYFAQVTGQTVEDNISYSGQKQGSERKKGPQSVSISEGRRELLDAATIRQQEVGDAILVYGQLPPARIKLRLYFKDKQMKALAEGRTISSIETHKLGLPALPSLTGLSKGLRRGGRS
jgi:type IV secretion system protein VirD4